MKESTILTGKYGSQKTGILTYFTQYSFDDTDTQFSVSVRMNECADANPLLHVTTFLLRNFPSKWNLLKPWRIIAIIFLHCYTVKWILKAWYVAKIMLKRMSFKGETSESPGRLQAAKQIIVFYCFLQAKFNGWTSKSNAQPKLSSKWLLV